MNRHPHTVHGIRTSAPPRREARGAGATLLLLCALTLLAPEAIAQTTGASAISSIVKSANIFTATVTAIALALATGAIGIGGYKIMFQGAQFRDVANLFVGAAVALSAAAIAAIFG